MGAYACPGANTANYLPAAWAGHWRPGLLPDMPGSPPVQGHAAVEGDTGSGTLTTMEIQKQADQASADQFFESVARLGASPVPGAAYRGTTTPVALICAVGHACTATPSSLQRGQEICATCVGPGLFRA